MFILYSIFTPKIIMPKIPGDGEQPSRIARISLKFIVSSIGSQESLLSEIFAVVAREATTDEKAHQ